MSGKWGLWGAALLMAGVAGPALAQERTLDQVLAACDRATGLPPGAPPPLVQPGSPRPKIVINPDWLRRPDPKDIAAFYPARAVDTHAGGRAIIRCQVGVDGRLHDCGVVEETPAGLGFGAAAMMLAPKMLFIPKRVNCEPVDGALVSIPIAFGPR